MLGDDKDEDAEIEPADESAITHANPLTSYTPRQLANMQATILGMTQQASGVIGAQAAGVIGAQAAGVIVARVAGIVNRLGLGTVPSVSAQYTRFAEQWASLTLASDYAKPDPPQGTYSAQMTSPGSYFESDEVEIDSVDDLHHAITTLIEKTPELPLVWRGVRDANWGMHSHLFRHLMGINGVVSPDKNPVGKQPYPDEDQMVAAERVILRLARTTWRFDDFSALETFARIQHAGGPTRLLDVTKNPYVGAWFAVEADPKTEDKPARLFALATRPVVKDDKPAPPDSTLQLDEVGDLRDPFWHALESPSDRQLLDWGTGARRRVWVPPAYDPRISAQNAAFILDGVPITSEKTASSFRIEHNLYWRRADLLAASSIYAKMHSPKRKPRYNKRNFAPTFSFRITANAKPKIREFMESRFGYGLSYIYPDMAALAAHLNTLDLSD